MSVNPVKNAMEAITERLGGGSGGQIEPRVGIVAGTEHVLQAGNLPVKLWPREAPPPSEAAPVVPLVEVERRAIANALKRSAAI